MIKIFEKNNTRHLPVYFDVLVIEYTFLAKEIYFV